MDKLMFELKIRKQKQ